MESIKRFLAAKLNLEVNSDKNAVALPWERKFLGFSFTNAGVPKRRIMAHKRARLVYRILKFSADYVDKGSLRIEVSPSETKWLTKQGSSPAGELRARKAKSPTRSSFECYGLIFCRRFASPLGTTQSRSARLNQ
jgi:hypothetical protein